MDYYPDNTLTKYTTKLHNEISLQGEWEVGLSEMIFPRNWPKYSIGENQSIGICIFTNFYPWGHDYYDEEIATTERHRYRIHDVSMEIPISKGNYASIAELITDLNRQMELAKNRFINNLNLKTQFIMRAQEAEGWFKFGYDADTCVANIRMTNKSYLSISNDLLDVLGFSRLDFPKNNTALSTEVVHGQPKTGSSDTDRQTMFVYCDVVECVPVGDTSAPLMRVIDIESSFETIVRRSFDRPRYLPLRKMNFEALEIDIRDGVGRPIPFENGTVIVTLHFRRANSSYLLT